MTRHRISNGCVPYLPRGVRLHDDRVRGLRVLLAPERAMQLDMIGDAILSELDGKRSLAEVIVILSDRYAAPADQIEADVQEFVLGLVDRRMVFLACADQMRDCADPGHDAGTEVGPDAGQDAGPEVGQDADSDADQSGGQSAGQSAGGPSGRDMARRGQRNGAAHA